MVDLTSVQPLPEAGDWPETIPRLESGWRQTGGAVNPGLDEGLANWQAGELAKRTRILRDRLDQLALKAAAVVTVGTQPGDYPTINAALAALSERRPVYVVGGFTAEVRLRSGFIMREQVVVRGVNLGWIRITSVDSEVQIDRSYLTTQINTGNYPAFSAGGGGYLPIIDTLFAMTSAGTAAGRHGIYVYDGAGVTVSSGKGIKAAGGHGVLAQTSAVVAANGADFRNALGVGAAMQGGTRGAFQAAILSGCDIGIQANNGASVHAAEANCQSCVTGGIRAQSGATINALGALARQVVSADGTMDFSVAQGATINAVGATGGTSVTPNTVTASGIIFK